MARFAAAIVSVSAVAAQLSSSIADYDIYTKQFGKTYNDPEEHARRYELFQGSVIRINDANARNGKSSFGWTWTTDLMTEEKFAHGFRRGDAVEDVEVVQLSNSNGFPFLDWRLTDTVTPVKNQGACGSCWAFSAVETIESHYILANEDAYGVSLSPKQLLDCGAKTGNLGCFGGDPKLAYAYVQSVPGLSNEWNWPYNVSMTNYFDNLLEQASCSESKEEAINGSHWQEQGAYAQISGYRWATPPCNGTCDDQDLDALAKSLELGPVSICVNASIWADYQGGVVTADACGDYSASSIDHCVQLVGYNRVAEIPYWIVRNSWSTTWGEHGYIYLEMANNTCGLANEATIPIISGPADPKRMQHLLDGATRSAPAMTV